MTPVGNTYKKETEISTQQDREFPQADATPGKVRQVIQVKVKEHEKEADK